MNQWVVLFLFPHRASLNNQRTQNAQVIIVATFHLISFIHFQINSQGIFKRKTEKKIKALSQKKLSTAIFMKNKFPQKAKKLFYF